MNKQELIEKFKEIGTYDVNIFGTKVDGIPTKSAIYLIKQLDEPQAGHADEAPRHVKNVLARLRELPLHDREVWLKAIMNEFEQDFSRAKWREGYEQGKFEGAWVGEQLKDADKIRRELNKPVVPQFVADCIKLAKEREWDLEDVFEDMPNQPDHSDLYQWFYKQGNMDIFARAWLDGYEVEKEKRYKVVMPNVSSSGGVLTRIKHDDSWIWIDTLGTIVEGRTHTRKELEDAGFGWVFDCSGIEVEEVTE